MSRTYTDLNLTNFPEQVDDFIQWLDITASDGPLIRQYTEAVQSGNMSFANQILAQIPSAAQKIIKANDLNKITQAMLAVERFYKSDVQGYIANKQVEWQAVIDQFTYQGDWTSGKTYQKNNLVSFYIAGLEYVYIAIVNVPAGVQPTDSRYWRSLTIRGQQGFSGQGLAYRGAWLSFEAYTANDAVTHAGALWMALQSSQNVEPAKGSNMWKLIMSLETTLYPIQDTVPLNQVVGDLWFNTNTAPTNYHKLEVLNNPANANDITQGKEAYDSQGNIIVGAGR